MSAGAREPGGSAGQGEPGGSAGEPQPGAAAGGRGRAADGLPYWLDVPYQPRPALDRDVQVDACVIGAGVTGLSCARRLAAHGLDTLVLERETVAAGASGRNGGFLLAGVAAFHNDARERYGAARARAMYARTLDAQEEIYALAAELGAGDSVRRVGLLRLAVSPEEAEHVRGQVEALHADGFPAELVPREELPEALRGTGLAGCLTERDGALDPARWIRLLARAAEEAGARICEGTAVRAPVPAPREGAIEALAHEVRARHVVIAADGGLPTLVPQYAGRVRARRLHMVATEPLAPILERPVYARWGYEYFQQSTDGRLLAGGFSDLDGDDSYTDSAAGSERVWRRIGDYVREELGAKAQISHRWTGIVGYSEDLLPFVGEVPGRPRLHVAGGYSGHGNVPGFMCGRDIADAIAGDPPEQLFGADR